MQPTSSPTSCPPSWSRQFWRGSKCTVVFLIVVFHLVVLAVRNPLDLWYEPIRDWVKEHGGESRTYDYFKVADTFTWKYTNLVGCEQNWIMFSPPMARRAEFLGYRFEFTDGSSALAPSTNEPDPTSFFRVGGWQWRKMEDFMLSSAKRLTSNDPEHLFWEACARHAARIWKDSHPDDQRTLARIVIVRREMAMPIPGTDPKQYGPPEETALATFDALGRLLP